MRPLLTILPCTLLLFGCDAKVESDSPGEFRSTRPADLATEVDVDNHVVWIFNEAVSDETIKTQGADGACTGEPFEVSLDDFATCVGGTVSVVPQSDRHKVDWAPAAPFKLNTVYKLRVNRLAFESFEDLEGPVTISFTTSATVSDGVRAPDNK